MSATLCRVCLRVPFRYTCPRCELLYCSVGCYRSHSSRCSEGFYQDQVEGELRSERVSDQERRKLEGVLAQLNQLDNDAEDSEDEDDADERFMGLAHLAESGDLQLEDLTEDELQRFHSELQRGLLGKGLDVWTPWWEKASVLEVPSNDSAAEPAMPRVISAPAHVCCTQARTVAHISVALSVLEVCCAYCHTMRAFNGDWTWDAVRVAAHMLHMSPVIGSQRVHATVGVCLQAVLDAAVTLPGGGFGASLDTGCISDAAAVLKGGEEFSTRALQETGNILAAAAKDSSNSTGAAGKRFQRGAKKLDFLASFAFHHSEYLPELADEAGLFTSIARSKAEADRQTKQRMASAHDGVVLPPMDTMD